MSTADIYHGNTAVLSAQLQSSILAVPGSPNAKRLKFDEFTMDRKPVRSPNNTVRNLAGQNKNDEMDERPDGSFTSMFCLNDLGFWLTLLMGAPTTTGTGPYTHTFTFTRGIRPTALFELAMATVSGTVRRRRGLGMMLNQLNWDPMGDKQQMQGQFLFANEVLPPPNSAFDSSIDFYADSIAATHRCAIYNDAGSNTLGEVTTASIAINNNAVGVPVANGQRGYAGYVTADQALPSISGQISVLFRDAELWDLARSNSSSPLVIISRNAASTHSLTATIPNIAFGEPAWTGGLSAGKIMTADWYWHDEAGAAAPTFVLVNGVASYSA